MTNISFSFLENSNSDSDLDLSIFEYIEINITKNYTFKKNQILKILEFLMLHLQQQKNKGQQNG